jgi:hypothetical protein
MPDHLTEEYHKARKQYALFAGLLMAWELIGVRLDTKLFPSANVELLTPEAAPLVLIVMVLYSGYRTSIEWYQCDERRRELRVSKIDFRVAHIIGIASLALFAIQRLLKVQLAEQGGETTDFSLGFLAGFYLCHEVSVPLASFLGFKGTTIEILRWLRGRGWERRIGLLAIVAIPSTLIADWKGWRLMAVGASSGFAFTLVMMLIAVRRRSRELSTGREQSSRV